MELIRNDGTRRNSETIRTWLARAAADQGRGLGLASDLVGFSMIYTTTRIGDDIDRLKLRDRTIPLMKFIRHLRNACAHGNRWHLNGGEPKRTASFRGLTVEKDWHGRRAVNSNIGPAEYLDLFDDLVEHLETLP